MYKEEFYIIAFRSRYHALSYSSELKKRGINCLIMSTPKELAVGCGLSLRFNKEVLSKVVSYYKKNKKPIVGLYKVERTGCVTRTKRINI